MNARVSIPLVLDTLAGQLEAACLLEAAARKPGNVHPGAMFVDLCFDDFVRSARVVAPVLALAQKRGVGRTVLESVQATQDVVGKNTNLGIALLLAPLAAVPHVESLAEGIPRILKQLTIDDSRLVYEAIRAAHPGGMGEVAEQNLSNEPTLPLCEIMQLAADRDSIARQYVNDFTEVLQLGLSSVQKWLRLPAGQAVSGPQNWEVLVQGLFLDLLHQVPDSLIRRKLDVEHALEASTRAGDVLRRGWPASPDAQRAFVEFDQWLRADGHRRNPGTTADLVAATLYAAIREGLWQPPAGIVIVDNA
ncbi:MAG: triphosphoribosyl-dephospho-CoA synthase [Planctomycetaceae bacterium]|nr:triphosphoribosyl-dephospho-CoA synthase [Planctomycetaceae bacterium]